MKVNDIVRNTVNGKVERIREISGNYINGYRSDLWVPSDEKGLFDYVNGDLLSDQMLTDICLGVVRWNKKFYKDCIYINNVRYRITSEQRSELSKHFQIDY